MRWTTLLERGREVREVDDRIHSVMPAGEQAHLYDDGRAAIYDLLVASRLYNRLIWGANVDGYREFAARAAGAGSRAPLLDAACGSMVFTAASHRSAPGLVVACDQSIEMLRRARRRLTRPGPFPENVVLLQADVTDLPFRRGVFGTVLCMNVLHHVDSGEPLLAGLRRVLAADGRLFLTSLIRAGRPVGDGYMNLLVRRGEFATPRSGTDLERILRAQDLSCDIHVDGHMAFISMP